MHLTIAWLFKLYKIEEKALIVYCTLMVEGIVKVVRVPEAMQAVRE